MIKVIIVFALTSVFLIGSVLLKPSVKIKNKTVNIYWIFVMLGALMLLILNLVNFRELWQGLSAPTNMNPLKILTLFISMTILSVFLDEVGFFRYLANWVVSKVKTSQYVLFLFLYIMVSILTIFTSNDIIILTFTPFICYFAKNSKISPIPYLVAEFVAANTWSTLLIIGNPTNIYLTSMANIAFWEYTSIMYLPTLFSGLVSFFILFLIFRIKLKSPIEPVTAHLEIHDKPLLIIGIVHLILCTAMLVCSDYFSLPMWIISLSFVISLFLMVIIEELFKKHRPNELYHCLKRAPWELVPFVISMYAFVLAFDKYQISQTIANWLGQDSTILKYGVISVLFANLINNIPMSELFGSITSHLASTIQEKAIYATVLGSNVGAFLTPIGALAGIMWLGILKKQQVNYSFVDFVKYGIIIEIPTLLAGILGLYLVLN